MVDDEAIVRKTMSAIFQWMGYQVVVASDGRQAWELFTCHAPELALMILEVSLPRVSGPEVVERLPTLVPRIPVLFITTMGDCEVPDAVRARFPVLQKPFKAETLIAKAKGLIQRT